MRPISPRSVTDPAAIDRAVNTPPLIYLRHGETDWNLEGRLQGHIDIPLNDAGRAQARRNGRAMVERFPDVAGYDFVASPLRRARETMEIVRRSLGLEPSAYRVDDRLKEIAHGALEGLTDPEFAARHPRLAAARRADIWQFAPPNGESYSQMSERVAGWLVTLDRPTAVVAHGGVGRALRARILGIDPYRLVAEPFPQDKVFHWRNGAESFV